MLVDREDHLAQLDQVLTAAAAQGARLATVAGPAASGKSTLVRNFTDRAAARGVTVLSTAVTAMDRTRPLRMLQRLVPGEPFGGEWADRLPLAVLEACVRRMPGPVVLVVDDAHDADEASLRCLFALVRQVREAPLLVLLAGRDDRGTGVPGLQIQPARDLLDRRIRIDPLPEAAVREFLAQRFGDETAARLAVRSHTVSGGNPRLLEGLAVDLDRNRVAASGEPMAGAGYREAVVHLIERCGPSTARIASGVAVLEEWATPCRLKRLLQMDADTVIAGIRQLNHAGILASGRFRHPTARKTVLAGMGEEQRAALHAGAAGILRDEHAPPIAIGRHLLAAERIEGGWEVEVLHDLAERAIDDGEPELALECLGLVARGSIDDLQQATTTAILARAEWRTDPPLAARRIPELADLMANGRLDEKRILDSASLLLWFGYDRVVADALARIDRTAATLPTKLLGQLRAAQAQLELAYPGTAVNRRPGTGPGVPADLDASAEPPEYEAATARTTALLARLRSGHPLPDLTTESEQLLSASTLLDEQTAAPTLTALTTLIATDRLSSAEFWCDVFIAEAVTARMASWQSLFTAARADIALRRGDLRRARADAQAALALASAAPSEVGIGWPLAVIAQVDTVTGHVEQAAEYLRVPVPGAVFRTPIGLYHLQARGRHLHATGHFQAALDDFEAIGRLVRQWQLDLPGLVPWRTDAAQTMLSLGHTSTARELAEEQLSLAGPAAITARASALRILAACSEPIQRPELLSEAVDILQNSGDQLELAHVVADFGRTQEELGHTAQARMMRCRAEYIAGQAGAERPLRVLFPPTGRGPARAVRSADEQAAELSRAERRVASLAARGYTNRQIAERLSVTVSTVEQHLTRVFRKLKVRSRTHLPVSLDHVG
ncbi:DNA-binding NarL/FixJ family response regulator [Kitasatospora sp. MAA4]|uniref:helix-turn-helix transcriptional regulator n=1 Tax=Kitasatospora sp. MAA4 TaxID=3035093 RepID=UPI002474F0B7|nr:helix-turn-helix transcriptional regulator [Kitasatospora sp. MAA4]MDH6131367.1 DNA-binding NarL/FixJ family response regulator [Kitasatospora sp. MAA4]